MLLISILFRLANSTAELLVDWLLILKKTKITNAKMIRKPRITPVFCAIDQFLNEFILINLVGNSFLVSRIQATNANLAMINNFFLTKIGFL